MSIDNFKLYYEPFNEGQLEEWAKAVDQSESLNKATLMGKIAEYFKDPSHCAGLQTFKTAKKINTIFVKAGLLVIVEARKKLVLTLKKDLVSVAHQKSSYELFRVALYGNPGLLQNTKISKKSRNLVAMRDNYSKFWKTEQVDHTLSSLILDQSIIDQCKSVIELLKQVCKFDYLSHLSPSYLYGTIQEQMIIVNQKNMKDHRRIATNFLYNKDIRSEIHELIKICEEQLNQEQEQKTVWFQFRYLQALAYLYASLSIFQVFSKDQSRFALIAKKSFENLLKINNLELDKIEESTKADWIAEKAKGFIVNFSIFYKKHSQNFVNFFHEMHQSEYKDQFLKLYLEVLNAHHQTLRSLNNAAYEAQYIDIMARRGLKQGILGHKNLETSHDTLSVLFKMGYAPLLERDWDLSADQLRDLCNVCLTLGLKDEMQKLIHKSNEKKQLSDDNLVILTLKWATRFYSLDLINSLHLSDNIDSNKSRSKELLHLRAEFYFQTGENEKLQEAIKLLHDHELTALALMYQLRLARRNNALELPDISYDKDKDVPETISISFGDSKKKFNLEDFEDQQKIDFVELLTEAMLCSLNDHSMCRSLSRLIDNISSELFKNDYHLVKAKYKLLGTIRITGQDSGGNCPYPEALKIYEVLNDLYYQAICFRRLAKLEGEDFEENIQKSEDCVSNMDTNIPIVHEEQIENLVAIQENKIKSLKSKLPTHLSKAFNSSPLTLEEDNSLKKVFNEINSEKLSKLEDDDSKVSGLLERLGKIAEVYPDGDEAEQISDIVRADDVENDLNLIMNWLPTHQGRIDQLQNDSSLVNSLKSDFLKRLIRCENKIETIDHLLDPLKEELEIRGKLKTKITDLLNHDDEEESLKRFYIYTCRKLSVYLLGLFAAESKLLKRADKKKDLIVKEAFYLIETAATLGLSAFAVGPSEGTAAPIVPFIPTLVHYCALPFKLAVERKVDKHEHKKIQRRVDSVTQFMKSCFDSQNGLIAGLQVGLSGIDVLIKLIACDLTLLFCEHIARMESEDAEVLVDSWYKGFTKLLKEKLEFDNKSQDWKSIEHVLNTQKCSDKEFCSIHNEEWSLEDICRETGFGYCDDGSWQYFSCFLKGHQKSESIHNSKKYLYLCLPNKRCAEQYRDWKTKVFKRALESNELDKIKNNDGWFNLEKFCSSKSNENSDLNKTFKEMKKSGTIELEWNIDSYISPLEARNKQKHIHSSGSDYQRPYDNYDYGTDYDDNSPELLEDRSDLEIGQGIDTPSYHALENRVRVLENQNAYLVRRCSQYAEWFQRIFNQLDMSSGNAIDPAASTQIVFGELNTSTDSQNSEILDEKCKPAPQVKINANRLQEFEAKIMEINSKLTNIKDEAISSQNPAPVGIKNTGTDCFVISVLQIILHTKMYHIFCNTKNFDLESERSEPRKLFFYAWKSFLSKYSSSNTSEEANNFRFVVANLFPEKEMQLRLTTGQHEAEVVLEKLIDLCAIDKIHFSKRALLDASEKSEEIPENAGGYDAINLEDIHDSYVDLKPIEQSFLVVPFVKERCLKDLILELLSQEETLMQDNAIRKKIIGNGETRYYNITKTQQVVRDYPQMLLVRINRDTVTNTQYQGQSTSTFQAVVNLDEIPIQHGKIKLSDHATYLLTGCIIKLGGVGSGHFVTICKKNDEWYGFNDDKTYGKVQGGIAKLGCSDETGLPDQEFNVDGYGSHNLGHGLIYVLEKVEPVEIALASV